MFSQTILDFGRKPNVIRDLSAYAGRRKAEIGAEHVFDFSIGSPNVPPPPQVHEAMLDLLTHADPVEIHSYTAAPGLLSLRKTIAQSINRRFGDHVDESGIYVTAGASGAIAMALKGLTNPGDEVIIFTPHYMEYLIYTKESLQALTDAMKAAEKRFGHAIYLLSDEPYRELSYDGVEVPYLMNDYDDTLVCYSYSKTLSIPGERMGYLAICRRCADYADMVDVCAGAARALGHICASNLYQRVIERCVDVVADVNFYKENRDILVKGLEDLGYTCIHPDGAFYLFLKSPLPDSMEFCEKAKAYELMVVPGHDFGVPEYLRVSYCVARETIVNALPAFAKLAKDCGL